MRGPTTNGLFCVLELFHYSDKVQYMLHLMCKFYLAMAPHGPVFSRYFPLPFHRHFELVFCHDVIVQIKSRDFTVGGTTVSTRPCLRKRPLDLFPKLEKYGCSDLASVSCRKKIQSREQPVCSRLHSTRIRDWPPRLYDPETDAINQ